MCLVAQLHKTRAWLILCPSSTLDDTQYFVFVRTPRIPESCCSLSKSTWMTLDCCVWLRNSTIPELDWSLSFIDLDDTQYFVFVRTPRIPEGCCSLSKSTWMTLDCCVCLRNSTIPKLDRSLSFIYFDNTQYFVFCEPQEYPRVAAVFPNRLGWLSTGCVWWCDFSKLKLKGSLQELTSMTLR